MDAHLELSKEIDKRLMFIPVSIAHAYIPETRSLAKELEGGAKKKESFRHLFGLFKLFSRQMGSIHIKLGEALEVTPFGTDTSPTVVKREIEYLAFKCFRKVGENMLVTPSSLLALVLLDEPSGAMLWQDILNKSKAIITYCEKFKIPCTASLGEQSWEKSLKRAMGILVGNKRVNIIGRKSGGSLYYSILENCRRKFYTAKIPLFTIF